MAEVMGLDKEKPNRVTKVAIKMLKCKWNLRAPASQHTCASGKKGLGLGGVGL